MLCLIVSLADISVWQMLFAIWDVADVIATEEDGILLFLWEADVIAIWCCGRCTTLQYVATHCIGWCYCQVADGIANHKCQYYKVKHFQYTIWCYKIIYENIFHRPEEAML